jgi:2-phosphosulfolactate phosphatase
VSYFDQHQADIRFEWGLSGIEALAPASDVVIIVDVLSFTTCVDIVVSRGGTVFPYRDTLSPASLMAIPPRTRLVLPSPNGSTLSLSTGDVPTLAGCLRNARAVAARAGQLGRRLSVIAAGERWSENRLLRPAAEDLWGAGAIISYLPGTRSVEAEMAAAAFRHVQANLVESLQRCASGQELFGRGFPEDVHLAGQLNVSDVAPLLTDGAYQ